MKEINIARTLSAKRKEMGVTQDELAAYIGVSKASVSKWETGQSYPDITFLPMLAAYFNISIDELIGYEPQMTRENIRRLYQMLCERFGSEPFETVLEEYRAVVKKYYSCFPLLLQMAVLLLNHCMAAGKERQKELLEECRELCVRVKTESGDLWLAKQAQSLEATCELVLNRPARVLDLLGESPKFMLYDEVVLANAYQASGDLQNADHVMQVSLFQYLIGVFNVVPNFLMLHLNNKEKFDEMIQRVMAVINVFHWDGVHVNSAMVFYLGAAQGYTAQARFQEALEMLRRYAKVVKGLTFPIKLHGDEFFDNIEAWFDQLELGAQSPRGEKLIKEGMLEAVQSPVFEPLKQFPQYHSILDELKAALSKQ